MGRALYDSLQLRTKIGRRSIALNAKRGPLRSIIVSRFENRPQLGPDGLASDAVREALDLCVSCKGCKRDCPTGVDMARMKIEFTHADKKKHGWTLKDKLIARLPEYAATASRFAGLLNLHGENIAQIAASRARIAQLSRVVLAGGFAHNNASLVTSITSMAAMFGVAVDVSPAPGFAGAIGAAIIAAESVQKEAAR